MKKYHINLKKEGTVSLISQQKNNLNRMLVLTMMLMIIAFLNAVPALAQTNEPDDHQEGKMAGMKMGPCDRMIALTEEAEDQLGGAHYKGEMPMKGSMKMVMGKDMKMGDMKMASKKDVKKAWMQKDSKKEMKMDGMKMDGMKMDGMKMDGMKMDGKEAMHQDHESKMAGAFFMAPNEMHHIEASFVKGCGFQLYIFNAFTKPIQVGRFQAFIKVTGDQSNEL